MRFVGSFDDRETLILRNIEYVGKEIDDFYERCYPVISGVL